MNGQWVGEYQGSNTGRMIIDIDLVRDHYEGSACAWDNNLSQPSSFVRFTSKDLSLKQQFVVPVYAINIWGDELSHDDIKKLYPNVVIPNQVQIDLEIQNGHLLAKWKTDIATWGQGAAALPKTRAALPSDLKPLKVKNWEEFQRYVKTLEHGRYVFRGQESNKWRLRTSYHRTNRAMLERFLTHDINSLSKAFSALTKHVFDLTNPQQHGAFVALAQHHGYPTPLLDWSRSPYVAAYFAFRLLPREIKSRSRQKNRIFIFDLQKWNELRQIPKLAQSQPHLSVLDALAIENQRMIPQQALSTMTNVDDIEGYIQSVEKNKGNSYLSVVDLPAGQRNDIMRELSQMGITAASMFPGLDGACEELRERLFS